jgi:hypothetical protein
MSEFEIDANNALLDAVALHIGAKNDRALALALDTSAPAISKIRHGHLAIGPAMQLVMIEHHDIPLALIRQYLPNHRRARAKLLLSALL